MAEYEERNQLDYRLGGDTIDEFGQKYKAEMTRVFRFLNDLKQNKINSIEYTEPSSGQLKAEDGKLYIRNESNDAWVLLGEIAANFGFKPADADFISSDELSHEKIDDVNAMEFFKVITTDNLPQAKIDDVKNADLQNMLVRQDIAIPAEGLVTSEPQKLVQTNNDGVLPVNILGNAAKLAGIRVDSDIIQDGQVLTYRAATNTWHNENKGVIGSGKALNLYDGEELLCSYVGDEVRDFDLGITANKKYVEDTVGSKADKTELGDLEQLIKQYVADELVKYLPLSGGAMTGSLILNGNPVATTNKLSMPSTTVLNLAIPTLVSGDWVSGYTAPADGWVCINCYTLNSNTANIIMATDGDNLWSRTPLRTLDNVALYLPVAKGDSVSFYTEDTSIVINRFMFFYAQSVS